MLHKNGSVRLSVQQQNLFFALVQREKRSASGTGRSSGASDPSDPSHHGSSSKNSQLNLRSYLRVLKLAS